LKAVKWSRPSTAARSTSDAEALLLSATDRAIAVIKRFAECFHGERRADQIEHKVMIWSGGEEPASAPDQIIEGPTMSARR
jgi:hypothetical protein